MDFNTNSHTVSTEASDRFLDFARAGSDWFFEVDRDLRLSYLTEQFTDLTGHPVEVLLGKTMLEIDALFDGLSDDPETLGLRSMHRLMQQQKPFRDLPGLVFKVDGSLMPVGISAVPVFAGDGSFQGYRGATADRSVDRESGAEQPLAQPHSDELHLVGQLTGGIAHDFNNLMAVIRLNIELFIAENPAANRPELLTTVLRAVGQGEAVTKGLLSYARKQPLRPEYLEAGEVLTGVQDILRSSIRESIRVHTHAAPDLWLCRADKQQLQTAVLNLALNARDAMPEGGQMSLEASNYSNPQEPTEGPRISCAPGSYVCFAVRDTGAGMTPEVIGQAFAPFFSTKAAGEGHGLGLSMVYGFARQSGGDIQIESQPGVGTTVRLYLPAEMIDTWQESKPMSASTACELSQAKVLMVEDDNAVNMAMSANLESFGVSLVSAGNAEEALELCKQHEKFDLLLLDVVLGGGMNGLELSRRLREDYPEAKIIFMTGYSDGLPLRGDPQSDPAKILYKPFGREDLEKALQEALANYRLAL